jgi:hypothetical protein
MRPRSALTSIVVLTSVLALFAVTGSAAARALNKPLHCGDVRVNRFLRPAPAGMFGAFGIVTRGAGCPAARDIARRYVHHPTEQKTIYLAGWKCTIQRAIAAQRVRVTCTRDGKPVSFADEVPNG